MEQLYAFLKIYFDIFFKRTYVNFHTPLLLGSPVELSRVILPLQMAKLVVPAYKR